MMDIKGIFKTDLEAWLASSTMYEPTETELGLVIIIQLSICLLLLAEVVDGVQGYDTLIGLGGRVIGTATALGAVFIILRKREIGKGGY